VKTNSFLIFALFILIYGGLAFWAVKTIFIDFNINNLNNCEKNIKKIWSEKLIKIFNIANEMFCKEG